VQESLARAIATMWNRYNEPLSLNAVADSAYLSRFYFSRLFRSTTGVSPGRFLTAVRLFKAKNLLLETSLSVTDIAYEVGYNSLGTFISRFTRSVGISPARYRWLSRAGIPTLPLAPLPPGQGLGRIIGTVTLPDIPSSVRIYVAAFDGPIVQGLPAACTILDGGGEYQLDNVPDRAWYVRAAAVAVGEEVDPRPWTRRPVSVGASGLVQVHSGRAVTVDLHLHPTDDHDLPILIALPELDGQVPSLASRAA
jgi:AraC family transcriptional regulator